MGVLFYLMIEALTSNEEIVYLGSGQAELRPQLLCVILGGLDGAKDGLVASRSTSFSAFVNLRTAGRRKVMHPNQLFRCVHLKKQFEKLFYTFFFERS